MIELRDPDNIQLKLHHPFDRLAVMQTTGWEGMAHPDGGIDIWFDVHGRDRPAVLLLMGAACQAVQWEPSFYQPIVDAGFVVIRFDYRDIGLSTWGDFRRDPYEFTDLVEDALAVADTVGHDRFHIVGFSMGGLVAQLLALAHPYRVISLSLLSSGFASAVEVPRSHRQAELYAYLGQPTAASEEQVDRLLGQWRLLCGRGLQFDEGEWRSRLEIWVARGQNARCPHIKLGPQVFGVDRSDALADLRVPTMILHGDDDPMFPVEHGRALKATIPDSSMSVLRKRGHDLFLDPTREIVPRVIRHLEENDEKT